LWWFLECFPHKEILNLMHLIENLPLNVVLISWKNLIAPGIIHIVYCIPFYTSSKREKLPPSKSFIVLLKIFINWNLKSLVITNNISSKFEFQFRTKQFFNFIKDYLIESHDLQHTKNRNISRTRIAIRLKTCFTTFRLWQK